MAKDSKVLLTGASGAIGAEVARRLAARGAHLALSARRQDRLATLADEIAATGGARPTPLPADLGRRGEAESLAARAIEALGRVDVVINNAGASMQGLMWVAGDRDEAREVVETNLWSPMALVAALVPQMLAQGSGTIVNVGSMVRVSPYPHLGHYAASRSSLAMATQVLGMELRPRGIGVVEVSLGPVDTPASRENRALAGADGWLDGRPGIGSVSGASAAIAAAAEDGTEDVVYYPRVLRWVDRFPGLGHRYARRTAESADLEDETVRLGGSAGDADLQALRDQWEGGQSGSGKVAGGR
jgi:short-subunit dehydrogenase